jgi:hypothetical protein
VWDSKPSLMSPQWQPAPQQRPSSVRVRPLRSISRGSPTVSPVGVVVGRTLHAGGPHLRFASSPASESLTDRQAGSMTLHAGGPHLRFASSPASESLTDRQAGSMTLHAGGPHLRFASSPASESLTDRQAGSMTLCIRYRVFRTVFVGFVISVLLAGGPSDWINGGFVRMNGAQAAVVEGAPAFVGGSARVVVSSSRREGVETPPAACQRGTFNDFHDQGEPNVPPSNYSGPVFKLRQDYPETLPKPEQSPWLGVDPSTLSTDAGALAYLESIWGYVTEGNIDPRVDWDLAKNTKRAWYHAPWLDYGSHGREFVHGLTHELNSAPGLLGIGQTTPTQTWAVGAYNALGAWAMGQVWCDPGNPQIDALNPSTGGPNSFPNGTAVWKLLFTSATPDQLPFLAGAKEWSADILTDIASTDPDPARAVSTVRLIQIDVAVRDDRLPNGWAFGTFTYSSQATVRPGASPWSHMVPVGLQWGNDPGITPTMVTQGVPLRESWLNNSPAAKSLPDNHRGWGGRLVGPLDNKASACMSCHQTAGQPAINLVPSAPPSTLLTDRDRLAWFVNTPAGVAFGVPQVATGILRKSTDYSLQTSMGLQNFYLATCNPKVANETVSARGESRASPAVLARANCPKIANLLSRSSPAGVSNALSVNDSSSGLSLSRSEADVLGLKPVLAAVVALALLVATHGLSWWVRLRRKTNVEP